MLHRRFPRLLLASLLLLAVETGCARIHRLHGTYLPAGSRQVGEVTALASRDEILAAPQLHDLLFFGGIRDADLRDGSVALVTVFCCHQPTAERNAVALYVPLPLQLEVGDVVEFEAGVRSSRPDEATLNRAITVHQQNGAGEGACRWLPEDPRLWLRAIYCDWMGEQGWRNNGGLYPVWYLPPQ